MVLEEIKKDVQKRNVIRSVVKGSKTDLTYYILLSVSTLIITLGLTLDSTPTVIGGMLMAPMLKPILAFGLGAATLSPKAILRSFLGILNSIAIILILSYLMSNLIHSNNYLTSEIMDRVVYSNLYLFIAVLSGLGATYTLLVPNVESALPGVAVSISLLPPLCVSGISLAQSNMEFLINSSRIFMVNLGGIILASFFIFFIFRFARLKRHEEKTIVEEEKN